MNLDDLPLVMLPTDLSDEAAAKLLRATFPVYYLVMGAAGVAAARTAAATAGATVESKTLGTM